MGEYHPENYTLREARAAAIEAMAAINRGGDPVAEAEAKAQAQTFKALAEQFLNDAPHLAATTRKNFAFSIEASATGGKLLRAVAR